MFPLEKNPTLLFSPDVSMVSVSDIRLSVNVSKA